MLISEKIYQMQKHTDLHHRKIMCIHLLLMSIMALVLMVSFAWAVIPNWNEKFYYRVGSTVIFEDVKFRAVKPSKGFVPDESPDYWQPLGDYEGHTYTPQLGFPVPAERPTEGIVEGGTPGADAVAEQVEESETKDDDDLIDVIAPINAPPTPVETPTVPKGHWDTNKKYAKVGEIVIHSGRRWANVAFTQGEEPGVSDVWVELKADSASDDADIVLEWSATKIYDRAGYRVKYLRKTYQNRDWSQGERPDLFDVWQAVDASGNVIEDVMPWQPDRNYSVTNTLVKYEGRVWSNRIASLGDIPGESEAWKFVRSETNSLLTWHASVIFDKKGTEVRWNSTNWKNKWWTQGDQPGESDVWEEIVPASDTAHGSGSSGLKPWDSGKTYSQIGATVTYDGRHWKNAELTVGDEPGKSAAWLLERASEAPIIWHPSVIFDKAGTRVIHNEEAYSNKWWTQGEEPGVSDVWETTSASSDAGSSDDRNLGSTGGTTSNNLWLPDAIYSVPNTIVSHNGQEWKNKWWTQGDQPGASAVWVSATADSEPSADAESGEPQVRAWNALTIYSEAGNVVLHDGQEWKNKWWTQGDKPGASDVWERI